MSNKKKEMTVREVLEMAFPDRNIGIDSVLNTNGSEYIEDWDLFEDRYVAVDDYLENTLNCVTEDWMSYASGYFDYDGFYDQVMTLNSPGYYESKNDFKLDEKWELGTVKSYGENDNEKVLYDDGKFKNRERER